MPCIRQIMICCGMVVKRIVMLGDSVRKLKALTEDEASDTDLSR